MPQKAAGIRTDPPESDPIPNADALVATNGPSPPDDPPEVKAGLCGFVALP